jgi:methylated-DNA-[protein]-cysteine S-methyltransferase
MPGEGPGELLDLSGVPQFQRAVLKAVAAIPPGQTLTYGQVARKIGKPKAARAVGAALAKNPFPLVIPCHRVVAAKGLGGYSCGPDLKRRLLDLDKKICQR